MVNAYYTRKGITYTMYAFKETSRLQYNILLGCSTIWRKYGIITGKLRMFIFVAIEMEKRYMISALS